MLCLEILFELFLELFLEIFVHLIAEVIIPLFSSAYQNNTKPKKGRIIFSLTIILIILIVLISVISLSNLSLYAICFIIFASIFILVLVTMIILRVMDIPKYKIFYLNFIIIISIFILGLVMSTYALNSANNLQKTKFFIGFLLSAFSSGLATIYTIVSIQKLKLKYIGSNFDIDTDEIWLKMVDKYRNSLIPVKEKEYKELYEYHMSIITTSHLNYFIEIKSDYEFICLLPWNLKRNFKKALKFHLKIINSTNKLEDAIITLEDQIILKKLDDYYLSYSNIITGVLYLNAKNNKKDKKI